MKKFLMIMASLVLASGISFSQVDAAPVIDFGDVLGTTGTISYAGGANPLEGTNISFDNVIGKFNTPLNNGVLLTLSNATLNFTSGNLTGSTSTSWDFGPGGAASVVLTGGIPSLSITDGSTLLTGTFLSGHVDITGSGLYATVDGFTDTKNSILTAFYGMPDSPYFGQLNLSFGGPTGVTPPESFESTGIGSGDIINSPIPEPATMLLLGSGLLGMGVYARRRFRK